MKEKKRGSRANTGKPKWSLVPQSALLPMVRVLEFGARKYAPYNWQKGLSITETCESLKRHLDAFMEGETIDPESGEPHIGHLQCNSLFLSWMMEHKPEMDDRHYIKPEYSVEEYHKIKAHNGNFNQKTKSQLDWEKTHKKENSTILTGKFINGTWQD